MNKNNNQVYDCCHQIKRTEDSLDLNYFEVSESKNLEDNLWNIKNTIATFKKSDQVYQYYLE